MSVGALICRPFSSSADSDVPSIREAYGMLANNFNPERHDDLERGAGPVDEIVLLGFSRGAFTARAITSLITDVGLLTKIGMEDFWGIFQDWKNQDIPAHKSEWFKKKFPSFGKDVAFTDPEYRNKLILVGCLWMKCLKLCGDILTEYRKG
jgi:uncharacterized protein (DUF2235 family)